MKRIFVFILGCFCFANIIAQKVGINALNPTEQLHIRNDESKLAIRLDNTKSVENGLNYGIVTGTPVALDIFSINPSFIDWTDLDHTKLVESDNSRLFSPPLGISPDVAGNLWIQFDFTPTIPSTAMITDVVLNIEWRRIGTYSGNMVINFWLQKASNNQWLVDFGHEVISSSTDVMISKSKKKLINPVTADMINLNDLYLNCWGLRSLINGTSGLQIDKVWLDVEYAVPADGTENVSWAAGASDGVFTIANSSDLLSNKHLQIDETGITELKGLKIVQNSGSGKVLTSNDEGRAYWANLPVETGLWINKNDTAYLATGPAQINNGPGGAALIFNKGESRLNNGVNMIETDNRIINIIIDKDNDQTNEEWNIFRNDAAEQSQMPVVRFELDGGDSWINGGGAFGIGTNSPAYPLHIGTDATNGNGAHLTTGGTWTNGSSRIFKENFNEVDVNKILEKLVSLKIQEWEYRGSKEGYHLGPIAEDFYKAFGLGGDEQYISTVDADGVSMAAIQALYLNLQEKDSQISELQKEIIQIKTEIANYKELKEEINVLKSLNNKKND